MPASGFPVRLPVGFFIATDPVPECGNGPSWSKTSARSQQSIHPPHAGRMLVLILRRSSETPSNVFAPRDHHLIGQAVTIRRLRSYVVDATRCFGKSG